MSKLPKDVAAVKRKLGRSPKHELAEIAAKLIDDTNPELIEMWCSLERRNGGDDDFWVWAFLSAATTAKDLPRYHHKAKKDRLELASHISKLAKDLALKLEANDLDANLVYVAGSIFNGFYVYEDFSEKNQASIDADGRKKLRLSTLISAVAKRSRDMLVEEPVAGKAGRNKEALAFTRKQINAYPNSLTAPLLRAIELQLAPPPPTPSAQPSPSR